MHNEGSIFENPVHDEYSNIKLTEIKTEYSENIFEEALEQSIAEEKTIIYEYKNTAEDNDTMPLTQLSSQEQYEPVQQSFTEIAEDESKLPELSVTGIVMDTYIICENMEKTEMYMIDQHAAHERINYEKFLNQYNSKEIIIQELLIPEVVNLSYEDYQAVMSNGEIYENLGFNLENFGANAILIISIPNIFRNSNIKEIFYTILDSLKSANKSNINLELDKIIKNACVKSVKAGDRLHIQEVKALLKDLGKTENPYTCPHGRPVIIKMTKYEIEKMFERIQN